MIAYTLVKSRRPGRCVLWLCRPAESGRPEAFFGFVCRPEDPAAWETLPVSEEEEAKAAALMRGYAATRP